MSRIHHYHRITQPHDGLSARTSRVIKYLISGNAYFWSGYLLFALFWSGFGWRLWWAKLMANLCGWSINFALQRFWVFNSLYTKQHTRAAFLRYGIITIVDFVIDYVIVAGLRHSGVSPYIGQFVSAGALTVWNYYWYRWWVFPQQARTISISKKRMHGI